MIIIFTEMIILLKTITLIIILIMFEERVRIEYSTDLLNFKINNIVIGNEDELNNTIFLDKSFFTLNNYHFLSNHKENQIKFMISLWQHLNLDSKLFIYFDNEDQYLNSKKNLSLSSIILIYDPDLELAKKEKTDQIVDEIKKLAEEELPNYMIPSKIILVKNIPLNSNGKLDRKKIIKNY